VAMAASMTDDCRRPTANKPSNPKVIRLLLNAVLFHEKQSSVQW
jgi:hypothetical protein